MTLMLMAAVTVNGWAGDNIQVDFTSSSPQAQIVKNGNDVTQGTIQLWYTVYANGFTPDYFGTFWIDMEALHLTGAMNASYSPPATLTLKQNGS